jgi:serine/threonine protein kinase
MIYETGHNHGGGNVVSEQLSCPTCQTKVGPDWQHCPNDGTRLARSEGDASGNGQASKQGGTASKQCPRCLAVYTDAANYCSADSSPLVSLNSDNSDMLIGQILGGSYMILSVIGEGGNSRVYKATHVILERTIAIKVMHAVHSTDDVNIRRFLQESRTVSNLNHPNIVALFDFGLTVDGRPYFCMDYVEGVCLQDVIDKEGRLPSERAVPIFLQLCDALAHAHKKGIIHRDLKPSNVLLMTGDGGEVAKLVDFGVAKVASAVAEKRDLRLTAEGLVCGSPVYMSPEQCVGDDVDYRTDIYSLGISLYEAITGEPPFWGDTILSLYSRQMNDPPVPLRELIPNVPTTLNDAVLKSLMKRPEERFQSMSEMKTALETVFGVKSRRSTKELKTTADNKIKILCVDDEEVSLLAYSMALSKNADFSVVGVAINGELAVQRAEVLKPDLVIMDYELPVINGADATRMIKAVAPETKILLLSSHSDKQKVMEAFNAGVNGYVLKSFPGERLFGLIRGIMQGTLVIDDQLDDEVIYEAQQLAYQDHIQRTKQRPFTNQEADVVRQLLLDTSDEEICILLKLDGAALQALKNSMLKKLNQLY